MNRDSWLFSWVTIISAYAGQLALEPAPNTWDWHQWMAQVVVLSGMVLAKLGTSPLKGPNDGQTVKIPNANIGA